jgi:subtilisin family serine protease
MKRFAALVVLPVLAVACADPVAPDASSGRPAPEAPQLALDLPPTVPQFAPRYIADEYIVVLNDDVLDVPGLARRLAALGGASPRATYDRALKGFAVHMSAAAAAALARDPAVAYVEQDQVITADATQSPAPSWGLDRIDQRNLPLSSSYTYNTTASNVYAYIIDTGIQTSHPDFGGRAAVVYDALGGNGQDCNGHGTHVAGTVGGNTFGVAKGVRLRAVRVLNCSGSGSTSGIISALNWLAANHSSPAVANMSLGGSFSSSLNTASTNLVNSGVYLAVAAGNSNANACFFSPASASGVLTVAASTSTDAKASYSNYGSCVEIYAPGSGITSDWMNSGTNTISGTSMATPHATGVAALYKAGNPGASASTVTSWIVNNATTGVVTGNRSGTPNRLLYKSTL